jgi:hypothetical protein
MGKRIFSVIIALVVSISLIGAFEYAGGFIFQHPAVDMKDPKTISNMMVSMPIAAFLWILLGYLVSSYVGGIIASFISGREKPQPALIVGAVLMAGGIMNLIMIPYHPIWFMVANVIVYIPFAWFGYLTVKAKPTTV